MVVILGIVFLFVVHWNESLTQHLDESPWLPSDLYRFTKPDIITYSPISLFYGTQNRPSESPIQVTTPSLPQITTPAYLQHTTSPPITTFNSQEIPTDTSISSSSSSFTISNSPLIVSNSNVLFNLWNILLNTTILPFGYSDVLSNSEIISSNSALLPLNSPNVSSATASPYSSLPVTFCNPLAPPACVDERFGFCISDDEYPLEDVEAATEFSELADQFSYKTIAEDKPSTRLLVNNTNDDLIAEKVICQSITLTLKPLRARNVDGDWRVIVQHAKDIVQREKMTICSSINVGCQNGDHMSRNIFCYNGKCYQKYVVYRLLAFDPCNSDRDVFVDSFKLQSECNCRLSRASCPLYRYDV